MRLPLQNWEPAGVVTPDAAHPGQQRLKVSLEFGETADKGLRPYQRWPLPRLLSETCRLSSPDLLPSSEGRAPSEGTGLNSQDHLERNCLSSLAPAPPRHPTLLPSTLAFPGPAPSPPIAQPLPGSCSGHLLCAVKHQGRFTRAPWCGQCPAAIPQD